MCGLILIMVLFADCIYFFGWLGVLAFFFAYYVLLILVRAILQKNAFRDNKEQIKKINILSNEPEELKNEENAHDKKIADYNWKSCNGKNIAIWNQKHAKDFVDIFINKYVIT